MTVATAAWTAAWAFDTQQSGPAPKPAEESQTLAPTLAPNLNKELGLQDPSASLPKSATGTEVRIPGLGVIGVIPKMDFGLELLYSASDPASKTAPLDDQEPGDLSLKGRVKRSF